LRATGAAVLQDIPDAVREHFSRRSHEVQAHGSRRRLTGNAQLDAALAKDGRPDAAAWKREATALGWTSASTLPHPIVARAKQVWRVFEEMAPEALAERFRLGREMPRKIEPPGIEGP
jgi:hypothetical protein